ncbi:MAG: hypothetical protein DWQ34_03510 [Planctomycetota bacterium]|nr:MAG: hypothetical protein DWQ29_12345 [Planctomycetota bacterium]REJ96604.1 MAG: hypothetical protein DWQ34_03510 [Planctomycetota bacterium]REK24736.1 MAG: hypothetical protein DWQ41_13450 [Planctomycetota bacterium]REK37825.1 MAG: hypothetical protein DWQ45_05975 [Planctomycetota bacterium]
MTNLESFVVFAQLASTLYMTGVIWFVQIVHYPLMAEVGWGEFSRYAVQHRRLTTWAVAPAMLIEAGSAVGLIYVCPRTVPIGYAWVGVGLVFVIWISTAALQVPLHGKLSAGRSTKLVRRLVLTNWVRTIAWTLRSAIVLAVASHAGA